MKGPGAKKRVTSAGEELRAAPATSSGGHYELGSQRVLFGRRQRIGVLDWVLALSLCVAAVVVGRVPGLSYLDYAFTLGVIYGLAAISSDLVFAYLGEANLGSVASVAVSAYTFGALEGHGIPQGLAAVAAILSGAVSGIIMGLPNLRIRGIELALVTFAFAWAIPHLITAGGAVTGAAQGMTVDPQLTLFGASISSGSWSFLVVGSIVFIVVAGIVSGIFRTRLGRIQLLLSGAEPASKAFGMNVGRERLATWALSGGVAGVAGIFYASGSGFLTPREFPYETSLLIMAAGVVGGATSMTGALVAGALVGLIPDILASLSGGSEYILVGAVVMGAIAVGSGGLFGALETRTFGRRSGLVRTRLKSGTTAYDPGLSETRRGGTGQARLRSLRSPNRVGSLPDPIEVESLADSIEKVRHSPKAFLQVEELSLLFKGLRALWEVSLGLEEGEWLGLVGPNGSGKSSVLNCISGAYRPTHGHIIFAGREITYTPPQARARAGVLRSFQTPRLAETLSVAENVWLGAWAADRVGGGRKYAGTRTAVIRDALRWWGLVERADEVVANVPYGTRKLIELARLSAAGGRLLLIDEPAAGLSPSERVEMLDRLKEMRSERGRLSAIIVEHDIGFIRESCDSVVALDHGEVIGSGRPDDVLRSDIVVTSFVGRDNARDDARD